MPILGGRGLWLAFRGLERKGSCLVSSRVLRCSQMARKLSMKLRVALLSGNRRQGLLLESRTGHKVYFLFFKLNHVTERDWVYVTDTMAKGGVKVKSPSNDDTETKQF